MTWTSPPSSSQAYPSCHWCCSTSAVFHWPWMMALIGSGIQPGHQTGMPTWFAHFCQPAAHILEHP